EERAVRGESLAPIPRFAGTSPAWRGKRRLREKIVGVVQIQRLRQLRVFEFVQGLPEGLGAVGGFGLAFDGGVDRPALLGDLGEVADAGAGDEDGGAGFLERGVDLRGEIAA